MKHDREISQALALLITFGLASPAAAITCRDGYQKVQGTWLATPYCQDDYVAKVAHQFGIKASAAEIRNNPYYKKEVCRFIGQDIRIKDTCNDANPERRGNF